MMQQQLSKSPDDFPDEVVVGDDGELHTDVSQARTKKEQRGLFTLADPLFGSPLARKIGLLPTMLLVACCVYFIGLGMALSLGVLSAYVTSGAILLGVAGIAGGSAAVYYAGKSVRQALDDLGSVVVSSDYEYQTFVASWTRGVASRELNLLSFFGAIALLLLTAMLLSAVFSWGVPLSSGPFRPVMFAPDYLNTPVSLMITGYFAVLAALVVGSGIKLMLAAFRLIAFFRSLQPIADSARVGQSLRQMSNLSVFASSIWLGCVALIGTLLFNTLTALSSLVLLALAAPGLYVSLGAQSAFRSLLLKADRDAVQPVRSNTTDLSKTLIILALTLLVLISPLYGQPLGAITGLLGTLVAPHSAVAFIERGNAYLNSLKYDRAAADYESAIQLDPHSARAYYNRGNLWRIQGKYDLALSDFAQAMALDSSYAWPYFGRGRLRYAQQDYDNALADFDQALKLYPGWADAYFQRGWADMSKTDYQQAEADFTKAIQFGESDLYLAYGGRGNARYSQGKYEAGIADCAQAIQLNGQYANGYYYRALIRHALKDNSGAVSDLKQVLQLSPSDNWAQQIQDTIAQWSADPSSSAGWFVFA